MKSLIPLSLMIHSEIIESNRWRTQKNPDENPKYSILSIHQLKIKNILLEVIHQWNYCLEY